MPNSMNKAEDLSFQAAKLIKEWSIWMVAVQLALIAYVGAIEHFSHASGSPAAVHPALESATKDTDIKSKVDSQPSPATADDGATVGSSRLKAALLKFAMGLFAISILAASCVLSGLPYAVICLSEQDDPNDFQNVFQKQIWSAKPLNKVRIWQASAVQHWTFGLGVVLFTASYII